MNQSGSHSAEARATVHVSCEIEIGVTPTFLGRDAPAPRPNPAKGFLLGPAPPGLSTSPSMLTPMSLTPIYHQYRQFSLEVCHWMGIMGGSGRSDLSTPRKKIPIYLPSTLTGPGACLPCSVFFGAGVCLGALVQENSLGITKHQIS